MKTTTYRNKIDALLGFSPQDVEEFGRRSKQRQQRLKQKARWARHLERKASA
jgi:hypothetical protein